MDRKELGIYVHIPFCVRKCAYCDFLSFPSDDRTQRLYFQALNEEIASFSHAGEYEAVSVYFGGGTPSLPDPAQISKTMDQIRRTFVLQKDAEVTIECNPGTLDQSRLEAYRAAGFNRLSIGLQSADNGLLRTLGRIHTFEMFREEFQAARDAGFGNINVDLMYGLPGQSVEAFEKTLGAVRSLAPEHISAYSLIIEEGTPFWERYHEDDLAKRRGEKPLFLPDEDAEDAMEQRLKQTLRKIGFYRYEISNYARPGRESRHNTGYWIRREYAGFGLGASGQIGKARYRNTSDLEAYLKNPGIREEESLLTVRDEIAETMILGLRMTKGVDLQRFEKQFGIRAQDMFAEEIGQFVRSGLLEISGSFLRLTERGFDVSNLVMCSFVNDTEGQP